MPDADPNKGSAGVIVEAVKTLEEKVSELMRMGDGDRESREGGLPAAAFRRSPSRDDEL